MYFSHKNKKNIAEIVMHLDCSRKHTAWVNITNIMSYINICWFRLKRKPNKISSCEII
jgi:hypothetical protein